jgi:hypothetical protein
VRLWQWLHARLQREPQSSRATILPPEPFAEVGEQLDLAIEQTRRETRRLVRDGGELAERIRRNARAGRDALEGKPR